MIFVTVGTHEQSFERLLIYIDNMIANGQIQEEVICQKGFSDYEPINYKADKLLPYEKMQENIQNARIVITHGGPASFLEPLKIGKIPIVVPRKKEFNEHVNDHQLEFSRKVEKRMNNIIVVEEEKDLLNAIINYKNIIKNKTVNNNCNNKVFCDKLTTIIQKLMK